MRTASLTHVPNPSQSQARRYRLAEEAVRRQGGRFTPIRRTVFIRLLESDVPLGAYDLVERLGDVGSRKPPTVYRALDWLIEQGLVARLASNSRYMAVGPDDDGAMAFLICRQCGLAEPMEADSPAASLRKSAEAHGFSGIRPIIELIGNCSQSRCSQP